MMELSFVFPCLNEEKTIGIVIQELKSVLQKIPSQTEIIVADNGSTDNSVKIAKQMGCKIVHVQQKGYGEALKKGFECATGKYIAFADADGSYPLEFLPKMYQEIIHHQLDMVVASRLNGKIEKGAMPFLHRYIGTPILTKIINFLFGGHLCDCNSGFRILKKETYLQWDVCSSGMEFASELLIKALKNKAKIKEIPAGLRIDKRTTRPHLKTWRDGMRHLLFILSEAPKLFEYVGLSMIIFSAGLELVSMIFGPLHIKNIVILDYHSKLILLGVMLLGVQSYIFSTFLYSVHPKDVALKITQKLFLLKEEVLLSICILCLLLIFFGLSFFVLTWGLNNFHQFNMITLLLDVMYWILFILMFSFGLIHINLFKKLQRKS